MTEETFPLVDDYGNIIGQAARSRCHDGSKLLHPVIHIHVFNPEGQLYLQKRSSMKEIFPNLWDSSVGGHIGLNEIPKDAALREAFEEIGLKDIELHFINKHIIETSIERELTYCFFSVTDQVPKPDMDEVSDGRFWNIKEIESNIGSGIFTPNFELDFKLFLRGGLKDLTPDIVIY